ncbi:MAG: MerR family transcriptional regulator [Leptospirillum sp.]|jgi:DNA-binding transcriptional MerR regulator|nr:MerR family transcriptional regulator [Nitrospiraceae bacterium]MDA8150797.1 MerR family transcriptional regulator [Nitrospiraceae bacterium]
MVSRPQKKFRIGEVSRMLGVSPSTLRYWESVIPLLSPMKTPGGQREYTEEDVRFLGRIAQLVRNEGRSLEGARELLMNGKGEQSAVLLWDLLTEVRKALQVMERNDNEIGA